MKAIWNDRVVAESDRGTVIEGNYYFPPEDVRREYLRESASRSVCFWKGTARYFDVVVDGRVNQDAAWSYPKPTTLAKGIAGHIAFWNGVRIEA